MPRPNLFIGAIATLSLCSLLIFLRFGAYLSFEPGMVIEPYGDGFKAYMSPSYHARYDSTYTHFEGMNYPYGDHLVMSDPQPMLTNTLKAIHPGGEALIQATINWTHAIMLLSILGCALFLYLLFARITLPIWYAGLAAIGLSFMAPMVARMGYHFGLAQPAALPVVLYLLLRFHESRSWWTSIWIAAMVLLFSLFHFHYLGLFVLGISLYYLMDILLTRSWKHSFKLLPHYSIQVLLPFVLLLIWLYGGAHVDDRASQPWGFLHYRARLEGLFTSMDQRPWQLVHQWVSPIKPQDVEAQNYIGLVAGLWVVLLVIFTLRAGFRSAILPGSMPAQGYLIRIFGAGLLLLLFSMGIPFIISPFENLIRYLGPLQQFRALGRFSWLFYFTVNITAFAWIGYVFREKKWVSILAIGVLALESYQFIQARDLKLDPVPGLQAAESLTQKALIDPDDFQAVLCLPFFHIGCENFWLEAKGNLQQEAMVLSMRTGLPLTSAMLSRTSLGQTLKQLQLVTEPYRLPTLLEDLPNDKPLLVLYDRKEVAAQSPKWDHFKDTLGNLPLLYVTADFNLYALPLDFFAKNLALRRQQVAAEIKSPLLLPKGKFLHRDRATTIYSKTWDAQKTTKPYQGSGGFSGKAKDWNVVFDEPIPLTTPDSRQLLSIWIYVQDDLRARTECTIREYDPKTGHTIQTQTNAVHPWVTVFDSNGWALLEIPFPVSQDGSKIQIAFQNRPLGKAPLFLDELLIRPFGTDLYMQGHDYFWKNNRFYPN